MPKSRSKRAKKQPPPKAKPQQSPEWVGILFFVLMGVGITVIIANYVSAFGGGTANWRLFYGLGLITGAFILSTQWH